MSDHGVNPGSEIRHSDLAPGLSGPIVFLIVFGCVAVCGVGAFLVYRACFPHQGNQNPDVAEAAAGTAAAELELVSSEETSYGDLADCSRASRECPICLEQFAETEKVFVFPTCQHIFHRTCVASWVVQRRRTAPLSCPLCRQGLEIAPAAT